MQVDIGGGERRESFRSFLLYYKILHNLTDINPDNFLTYHNPLSSLRQNLPIVTTPLSATTKYLSTLPFRSLSCWNFLPIILRNQKSFISFKLSVKSMDLSSFLYGSVYSDLINFNLLLQ